MKEWIGGPGESAVPVTAALAGPGPSAAWGGQPSAKHARRGQTHLDGWPYDSRTGKGWHIPRHFSPHGLRPGTPYGLVWS